MLRVPQPLTVQKLIPIIRDEQTRQLLDTCKGNSFVQLRDQALIRMYYNTGGRLSEIGGLLVTDVDLDTDSVVCTARTARTAASASGRRRRACSAGIYVHVIGSTGSAGPGNCEYRRRGVRPLKTSGIQIRLKRR